MTETATLTKAHENSWKSELDDLPSHYPLVEGAETRIHDGNSFMWHVLNKGAKRLSWLCGEVPFGRNKKKILPDRYTPSHSRDQLATDLA